MRKVIYTDNAWKDSQSGFFHSWSTLTPDAFGLIEDANTGNMRQIQCTQFRFVQPPEDINQRFLKELSTLNETIKGILSKLESIYHGKM